VGTEAQQLDIDYQRIGHNGKARLTARLPDSTTYTDKVDVADARERERFIRGLCKGRKGIDRKAVASALERIAGELLAKPTAGRDGGDTGEDSGGLSQADRLVLLAQDVELFHTPGGSDSEGFASLEVNGHRETWPVSSRGFRRWLSKRFYDEHGKAPGSQALQDALNVIAGKALHEGPEYEVAVRLAEQGGFIWLDLADPEWRVVQIGSDGWAVLDAADCPARFVRRRGMLALPEPMRGGRVDELRPLVNVPDDDAWALFVSWLVAAMRPGRPFPILVVNGEQGSAKSTLCRMARALIDPNIAPLRRPPRDDRDLMIAAGNGWVVGYDNLSGIRSELSDALCCLATGGGFGIRELYSDDDEKLFSARRPILLNGIEDVASRADLLDRAITLTLFAISDERRRDEDELWRQYEAMRPRILGALLDAVSGGLRNLPSVKLHAMPRMADFAKWATACEPALGWPSGTFQAAYAGNRGVTSAAALECSILAPAVFALAAQHSVWEGTARQLLGELETRTDEKLRRHRDWPTTPRRLAGEIRRLAPNLRTAGVGVSFEREAGGQRRRLIRLERTRATPSPPSPRSPDTVNARADPEQCRDDRTRHGPADRPCDSDGVAGLRDGRDGRDVDLQDHSNGTEIPEEEVVEWTG
jgi:hypothetical protein